MLSERAFKNVLCELALVVSCVHLFFTADRYYDTRADPYWQITAACTGAAALVGAIVYAGGRQMIEVHQALTRIAETVGITALLLANVMSVRGSCSHRLDVEGAAPFVLGGSALVLIQAGFNRSRGRSAVKTLQAAGLILTLLICLLNITDDYASQYAAAGLLLFALADEFGKTFAGLLHLEPVDILHLVFAVATLAFTHLAEYPNRC